MRSGELANPEAWLRTVALNHLRSGWRHASVLRRIQPAIPGPARVLELEPDHVAVVQALGRLEPDLRNVAVLFYLVDLPVREVADELGIAVGTVKSRLSRCRAQLEDLLGEREELGHA